MNSKSGNNIRHIPTHNDSQNCQIFKLFYQNVRSLLNKVDELLLCIAEKNFNVLCISEHWLDSATMKILCLSGYVLGSVFCRSDSRGGGVAIFLESGLEHREVCVVSDFTVPKCAEITCTYINKFDLNIITLYRPPSANFDIFIEKIEGAITALGHEKRVLLVGDFNVLFNTDDRGAARLTDLLGTYGFSSLVHTSTRGNTVWTMHLRTFCLIPLNWWSVIMVCRTIRHLNYNCLLSLRTPLKSKPIKSIDL